MKIKEWAEKLRMLADALDELQDSFDVPLEVAPHNGVWQIFDEQGESAGYASLRTGEVEMDKPKRRKLCELCETCGSSKSTDPHPCPAEEMGDSETLCNCCDDCVSRCSASV